MDEITAGIVDFIDECRHAKLVNIIAWVLLVSIIVIVLGMDIYSEDPAFVTTFY